MPITRERLAKDFQRHTQRPALVVFLRDTNGNISGIQQSRALANIVTGITFSVLKFVIFVGKFYTYYIIDRTMGFIILL